MQQILQLKSLVTRLDSEAEDLAQEGAFELGFVLDVVGSDFLHDLSFLFLGGHLDDWVLWLGDHCEYICM